MLSPKTRTYSAPSKACSWPTKTSNLRTIRASRAKWTISSKTAMTGRTSKDLIMIRRLRRRLNEWKCRWGKRTNWSLRTRWSMLLKRFWGTSLGNTRAWKVSRAANGISYRICPRSTIESSFSKTTRKPTTLLSKITFPKASLTLSFTWR